MKPLRGYSLALAEASWALALALLLGISLVPSAAADAPVGVAEFTHANGWDASGDLHFECQVRGFRFHENTPVEFRIESPRGTLQVYETWLNRSSVYGPVAFVYDYTVQQNVRSYEIPAGPLAVSWPKDGRGVARDAGGPKTGGILGAEFDAARASLGAPVDRVKTGFYAPHKVDADIVWLEGDIQRLGRRVIVDEAPVQGHGDLYLLAWQATFEMGSGFRVQLPPFRQELARTGFEEANVRTLLLTHASLRVPNARIEFPPGVAEPVCAGLDATIRGAATFHDAVGDVAAGSHRLDFRRQEFTLAGAFDLSERLEENAYKVDPNSGAVTDGISRSRATGQFEAVGLDFALVATPAWDARHLVAQASVAAVVLVVLGWVATQAGRFLGFYYTRLAPQRVLDHPTRFALAALVAQEPGLILRDLVRTTGRPYGVVRHHARVLEAAGRVKLLRLGRAIHLYPSEESLVGARRRILLVQDAPVRCLVDFVARGPASPAALQAEVRRALGLSRMGAWKALRRAVAARLVERVDSSNGTLLCTPTPSPR